jgi:hypothetical protein
MRRRLGGGRRGPGLLGAIARTAVIAGTATAVSGRVADLQGRAAAPAPPPAAPAAPGVSVDDLHGQLMKLAELKQAGLLTEIEFAQQKSRLLGT